MLGSLGFGFRRCTRATCAYRSLRTSAWLSSGALQGETVRVGCSSGFWGDTTTAAPQLVHKGNIDYLVADYLSEITMSLLTAAKQKSPKLGYAPDFVRTMKPLLKDIKQKGIRVVSNAGGVNPHACVTALSEAAAEQGVELSVAMVTGDELMDKIDNVRSLGIKEMASGQNLPQGVHSMNAYLGAFPIAEALSLGADVVVTGRCVDSALTLGPLIHQFNWSHTDVDLLAAGSLAGHLVECGAQATGGIFTDWQQVNGWDSMGFPIVECAGDGQFVLSKPEHTGGLVSWGTVAEQLVYEIGDPTNYVLPDVCCDFSHVTLEELKDAQSAGGAVLVSGAKGKPPPNNYKVSATYADGYRSIAVCPVVGPLAVEKAQKVSEAILSRTRGIFKYLGLPDYTQTHVHVIGSGSSYGHNNDTSNSREVCLWLGVRHTHKQALEIFSREVAPAGTGMAPGLTTLVGGRPSISPVLRLFSFLYPKEKMPVSVYIDGKLVRTLNFDSTSDPDFPLHAKATNQGSESAEQVMDVRRGHHNYRLQELAYLRSGDKGNTANIGVITRHPSFLPYIQQALTTDVVRGYFSHFLEETSTIARYELPGIGALNFVIRESLGGGGVASLRIDPQGKAYAQMLGDYQLTGLPELNELIKEYNVKQFAELD